MMGRMKMARMEIRRSKREDRRMMFRGETTGATIVTRHTSLTLLYTPI